MDIESWEKVRDDLYETRRAVESTIATVGKIILDANKYMKDTDPVYPIVDGYYKSSAGCIYWLRDGSWSDGWGNPEGPEKHEFPLTRLVEES